MLSTENSMLQVIQHLDYLEFIRAMIILFAGWLIAKGARLVVTRLFVTKVSAGDLQTLRKITYNIIILMFFISALRQMGFNLEILLGAAGIFTVAFGFASQTSASNLVSGLFLLGDRPFVVGDVIKINEVTGKVLSIDLLSTKLATDDNTYVRIPNELLIKTPIANISRLVNRRVEIHLTMSAEADFEKISSLLLGLARHEPLAQQEPAPFVKSLELTDFGIKIQLLVWCVFTDADALKNSLLVKIKQAFTQQDIKLSSNRFYFLGNNT